MMDAERYRQCKNIYKFTKKIYKQHLKTLKAKADAELLETVTDYKDSQSKYLKCRNEYRNTKLMWKAVFFIFRKLTLS